MKALEEHGPLTTRGLAKLCGLPRAAVAGAVHAARKNTRGVHIASWQCDASTASRLSAVWGFGPGQDAPTPADEARAEAHEREARLRQVDAYVQRVREKAKSGELNHWLQLLGV